MIGLISAVVTIIPIFFYVFMTDPVITATAKTYDDLNHEIYFQRNTVWETEADQFASVLTQAGFFDNEQQKSILLERFGNNYFISIPLIEGAWDEQEVVDYYKSLRDDVQSSFRENAVVINLCDESDITLVRRVVD